MATYYAVAARGKAQYDVNTGQVEIYETAKQAQKNCPSGCEVVPVTVRRTAATEEDDK